MQFVFAQAYQVTDSFGKHKLKKPPERVVVTDRQY
jgi:ABC-type enterochelin transport system substrate-binding protein